MTVAELIQALMLMPQDWPVMCQGTSVSVTPNRVAQLGDLRADTELDTYDNEMKPKEEIWSFDYYPDQTAVILTK